MLLRNLIPNIFDLIPYEYQNIRNEKFDKLISFFLANGHASSAPKMIHMLGIPGAGKSTFYNNRGWNPHIFIGFDTIMEKIPEYQEDILKFGAVESFAKWELPARIIGYELLRRAVEAKYDIFLDHGGLNNAHLGMLRNLRQQGWFIEMHYIKCDLETAVKRTEQREKETLRHTPRRLIEERYRLLQALQSEYEKTANAFYVYDSLDRFLPQATAA